MSRDGGAWWLPPWGEGGRGRRGVEQMDKDGGWMGADGWKTVRMIGENRWMGGLGKVESGWKRKEVEQ